MAIMQKHLMVIRKDIKHYYKVGNYAKAELWYEKYKKIGGKAKYRSIVGVKKPVPSNYNY